MRLRVRMEIETQSKPNRPWGIDNLFETFID